MPMTLRRFVMAVIAFLAVFVASPAFAADPGIQALERSLKLNPIQQQQFDVALQATQRAMLAIGLGALQLKTRLGMELLKDRPDAQALAQAQDELVETSRPLVRNARDEWLRFYSMLDDEQVGTARGYMEERLRKLDQLAEKIIRELAGSYAKRREREPLPQ
jgi:hypothetical protein